MPQPRLDPATDAERSDSNWRSVHKVGAAASLTVVLAGLIEMTITFLPGGSTSPETAIDWFTLFQGNWFLGLSTLVS